MTPEDVAALLAAKPPPATVQAEAGGQDAPVAAGAGTDDDARTEELGHVLRYVGELNEQRSETLDLVAQKIGDGSRDAAWRLPLGQSGLLDFFLGLLATDGLRPTLAVHALRVIGNSCADTDENRARAVASDCLPRMVQLLRDDALVGLAIPVLYNTCVDYEPAQTAAYKAGLNPELVSLLSGPRRGTVEPFVELICKLLELIATQEPEANLVHPATPFTLLSLATAPEALEDGEDFLSLTSVALAYLSHERFQQSFLETPRAPGLFMAAFSNACLQLDAMDANTDMAAQIKKVRTVFLQSLADLSAHSLFAAACPIDGHDVRQLGAWLSSDSVHLQSGACLALGNVARSDATCTALVQGPAIHEPLAAIVANPAVTDAQLLHSVLGFLKNLAIPAANKPLLGAAGLLEAAALPRIWALDTQVQVQFGAVSLGRLLATSCPPNVRRLCAPFPDDDAAAAASASDQARTPLQRLVGLVKRSDQDPTRTEAARAVAAVLRVLHSDADAAASLATPAEDGASPLRHFYATHEGIPEALGFLATQDKFPVLRSELWFVLALISRSPEGAECAALCLRQAALAGALRATVLGRDGPGEQEAGRSLTAADTAAAAPPDQAVVQQLGPAAGGDAGLGLEPQPVDPSRKADMARKDRENALVLVAELLQRHPEKLADADTFKDLLRTGSQMVIDERAASPAGP